MNNNKKMLNITLLSILSIILALGMIYGASLIKEKQSFMNALQQSETIIVSMTDKEGIESRQYCQRNNMKYSKGSLSCFVTSTKLISGSSQGQVEKVAQKNGWVFTGNNDIALNDSENTYTIANLYENGRLKCFIRQKKINDQQSVLEVGCSGSAKAEWFPVRDL